MGSRRYEFEIRIDGCWRNLARIAPQLSPAQNGGKEGIGRRGGGDTAAALLRKPYVSLSRQQLWQLSNIHNNAPRVIEGQHASDVRLVDGCSLAVGKGRGPLIPKRVGSPGSLREPPEYGRLDLRVLPWTHFQGTIHSSLSLGAKL